MSVRTVQTIAMIGVVVIAGLACSAPVAAQDDGVPPIKGVVKVKPAAAPERPFVHGMQLEVKLKAPAGKKVTGTLVWKGENYIVVRENAGAVPTKILGKDIQEINELQIEGKKKPDGVKFAAFGLPDGKVVKYQQPNHHTILGTVEEANAYESEINKVEFLDGGVMTVWYTAPSLSSKEKQQLSQIQSLENKVARLEQAAKSAFQQMQNAAELQSVRTDAEARYLFNHPLSSPYANRGVFIGPENYGNPYARAYPYYYTYRYRLYGPSQYSWFPGSPYSGYPGWTYGEGNGASGFDQIKNASALSQQIFADLAKAREELEQAQSDTLYNPAGRLVAVKTWK